MDLDPAAAWAVQELADVGARHGRPPEPVPEADPWGDDPEAYPWEPPAPEGGLREPVVVHLPGVPSVVVRLHQDRTDQVVVEDVVELEVPRRDTPAVVDALLSGDVWRRPAAGGRVARLVGMLLGSVLPGDLEVAVHAGGATRTYTAPLAISVTTGPWLAGLRDGPPPSRGAGERA